MRCPSGLVGSVLLLLVLATPVLAQAPQSQPVGTPAGDRMLRMNGVRRAADGRSAGPVETVTYSIYDQEAGGSPLWQETQNVSVDSQGRYSLLLGAVTRDGIPPELFATGAPRWVGVQWQGLAEAPRYLLTTVPYALNASVADTLGGRPATDFLLSPQGRTRTSTGTGQIAGAATPGNLIFPTSLGTAGRIGKFFNSTDLGDSVMFESGGMIGLGTTAPLDNFHVQFTNTNGGFTGYAVQNLGNTATSYSGMLFYDQNGALGQFQGFNNSTHEYRINNIASSGSINFMLGSASKFRVNPAGNVEVAGTATLTSSGNVRLNGGEFEPLGTVFNGLLWVNPAGVIQAHLHRFGAVDNNLYVTNNGGGDLTGVFLAPAATSWTSTSDERLKTDIEPLTGILEKIKRIRVVGFNMASLSVDRTTKKAVVDFDRPKRTMKNGTVIKHEIGSIAQDWIADFPELVVEPKTDDEYYGLNYERIGVVALGGVKELTALVEAKDAEIKALSARLAVLEQALRQLTQQTEPVR